MSKQRLKKPRLRLFVALEIEQATRAILTRWQSQIVRAGAGDLRASPADQLHVTLAFLGYRYEKDLDRIARAVTALRPRSLELSFETAAVPKPAKRPRLYAAALQPAEALMELRAETVAELDNAVGFKDERRQYWPHVTLCRVKSSVKQHRALDPPPIAPPELSGPAHATAVTLFSSELDPSGAVHTPLTTLPLPARNV